MKCEEKSELRLAMEFSGRGGPSSTWLPKFGPLTRAIRVDERAHPVEKGRVIPDEPDSDLRAGAIGYAGLSEEDGQGQEVRHPSTLLSDLPLTSHGRHAFLST